MSKELKKLIDTERLKEFKNKLVGTDSAYVQTGAVDQTVAGTKTFSKPIAGSVTGNAATATKLAAKRTIALSGAATGTATGFDGSGNIAIPVTSLDASKLTGTASVNTTGNAATATKAVSAGSATNASHATSADKATKAEQDGNGNNIVASYVAAGSEGSTTDIGAFMAARPSFIKSFTYNNVWTDAISMRHRNGSGDGSNYGTYIRSSNMTGVSNLLWNHEYGGNWQGERTLIDSANLAGFILSMVYPVGSVYISVNDVSPERFLGGTWQAIEQGRMLMAAGSSWQAGTTGGAAYHTLTVAEMPAHDHSATETAAGGHTHEASTGSAGAHSHSGSTDNAGDHTHTRGSMNITGNIIMHGTSSCTNIYSSNGAFYGSSINSAYGGFDCNDGASSEGITNFSADRTWTGSTSSAGAHSHWLSISSAGEHTHSVAIAAAGAHTHAITIGKTGSGAAFSILPPYIAVYMWRRTA